MNARVLPEPVAAMPTTSRPERAIGQPCDWMAVGALKPARWITSRTSARSEKGERKKKVPGKGETSNDKTGLGMFSP